jgi:single-strand DNA-binding protein
MKGLNKAYLIGHLGQDPELRTTANGKQIVKVSLATPNVKKAGETWVETPDWHRLVLFDKNAEFVANYGHKGAVLAVECAIRPNKWTDKDNVVRYEVNLMVDRVLWLNGKQRGTTEGTIPGPTPTMVVPAPGGEPEEESIPF